MNSLILSKLWHLLCPCILHEIYGVTNLLINNGISLDTDLGGLRLLSPTVQQLALHLRWLCPLMFSSLPNRAISSSLVLPRMIAFLQSLLPLIMTNLDCRILFLFPNHHPPISKNINSSLSLLYKAIDCILKEYRNLVVTAATCLEIPVSSIISPELNQHHLNRSAKSFPISMAYNMNSSNYSCLRPKRRDQPSLFPTLLKKIQSMTSDTRTPFFIRAFVPLIFAAISITPFMPVSDHTVHPFLKTLGLINTRTLPTRKYKGLVTPTHSSLQVLPQLSSQQHNVPWKLFWSLSFSHTSRNIWYRFLQSKIPSGSILHRFILATFPSPVCQVCQQNEEDLDHMLFACPMKLFVWQNTWNQYVAPSNKEVDTATVRQSLTSTRTNKPRLSSCLISPPLALAKTLESIWLRHWGYVFHSQPFAGDIVTATVTKKNPTISARTTAFF